jgi:hypothetical protein
MGLIFTGLLAMWGGRAIRRFTPNLLEQLAFGGALGLAVLAYCAAGFAAVGFANAVGITASVVLTVGALGGLMAALKGGRLRWSEARLRVRHPLEAALTLAAGLLALMGLTLCALPPDGNEWDALAYHFAFPKLYLQAGRMLEIPFMHQAISRRCRICSILWG